MAYLITAALIVLQDGCKYSECSSQPSCQITKSDCLHSHHDKKLPRAHSSTAFQFISRAIKPILSFMIGFIAEIKVLIKSQEIVY